MIFYPQRFKTLAQSKPQFSLKIAGYLENNSKLSEEGFQRKQQATKQGHIPSIDSFSYTHCVLFNSDAELHVLRQLAEDFAQQIIDSPQKGQLPPLPLDKIKVARSLTDKLAEKKFYAIHILIEALAGPVFQSLIDIQTSLSNASKLEPAVQVAFVSEKLKVATKQFKKINHIMAVFTAYISVDEFMSFRDTLKPASGAQSPLRFLDPLMYNKRLNSDMLTDMLEQEKDAPFRDWLKTVDFKEYYKLIPDKARRLILKSSTLDAQYQTTRKDILALLESNKENAPKIVDRNESIGKEFLEMLYDTFPPHKVKFLARSIKDLLSTYSKHHKLSKADKDKISETFQQLSFQRILFKLLHYSIIQYEMPREMTGTGGTFVPNFLGLSIMREILGSQVDASDNKPHSFKSKL